MRRFLEGSQSAQDFITKAAENADRYEGFNLLCGELTAAKRALWFVNAEAREPQAITAGIHGFSNASLDTPWPKLLRLRSGFRHALAERDPAKRIERLQRVLHNATPTPDAQLPRTGVPFDVERMLGSIFIRSGHYGTRASTVLSVADDQVMVREGGFGIDGEPQGVLAFDFHIQPSASS